MQIDVVLTNCAFLNTFEMRPRYFRVEMKYFLSQVFNTWLSPNKGLSGRPSMTNLDFKIQFLWFKVTGRIIKTLKSNVFFSFIRIKLIFQIEIQMQDGWRHQFYSSYPDSEIFFRIFYIHRALSLRNVHFKQWS